MKCMRCLVPLFLLVGGPLVYVMAVNNLPALEAALIVGLGFALALILNAHILYPVNNGRILVGTVRIPDPELSAAYEVISSDSNARHTVRPAFFDPRWKDGEIVAVLKHPRDNWAYPIEPRWIVWFACSDERRQELNELLNSIKH